MWGDLKTAYHSWWAQITMLLSALAIFSFVARVVGFELSDFIALVVRTYRDVFHPIIDFLTIPLPFSFSEWQKDAMLCWVAVGGATARTFVSEFSSHEKNWSEWAKAEGRPRRDIFGSRSDEFRLLLERFLLVLAALVAWPITWTLLFREPYLRAGVDEQGKRMGTYRSRKPKINGKRPVREIMLHGKPSEYIADMRVVLAVQIMSVTVAVASLIMLNVIGVQ